MSHTASLTEAREAYAAAAETVQSLHADIITAAVFYFDGDEDAAFEAMTAEWLARWDDATIARNAAREEVSLLRRG